jgi:hypothetical protein
MSRLVLLTIPGGKELASVPVGFLPRVRYFPDESRIIFSHELNGSFQGRIAAFGGEDTTCLEGRPAVEIRGITPISEQEVIGLRESRRVHTFVRLKSSDCSIVEESPADPAAPGSMFRGDFFSQPAVSLNREVAGYFVGLPKSGPKVLILRRLSDAVIFQRIEAPEDWLFWGLRFTPDSRLALVDAYRRDRSPGEPDARHRVLVYDVSSGRLVRTLDIDARDGLAVSPDGRLLAAGSSSRESTRFGDTRVKAVAVLYDFESGRELSRAEHSWFKTSPGMRGTLTGLEFSGDDQYLITSTQDVRVWRIEYGVTQR